MATDEDPFFASVEVGAIDTSAGPCEAPVRLYDAAVIGLVYRVEPERAATLVASQTGLEPLVTMGKAMVQIMAIEAREASLGPFAELAVALQVHRSGTSPSKVRALLDPHRDVDQGYLALGVAVSTEAMRAACEGLWGLPADLADVQTDFREAGIRAEVQGQIELMVGEAGTMKTPGLPITLVGGAAAERPGALLRTTIDVDHRLSWGGSASVSLRVTGEGSIAETVLRLGLEGKRPSYVWRSLSSRVILPAGVPLDD